MRRRPEEIHDGEETEQGSGKANNAGCNAHKETRREVTCGSSIGLSESLGVALIQFAVLNVNCWKAYS